jgi:hypothetical protein
LISRRILDLSEKRVKTLTLVAGILFIVIGVIQIIVAAYWHITLPPALYWNLYYLENPGYGYPASLLLQQITQKVFLLTLGIVFIGFAICGFILAAVCLRWRNNPAAHRKGLLVVGIIGIIVGFGIGVVPLIAYYLSRPQVPIANGG